MNLCPVVLVGNRKGGAGKSSLARNVGSTVAANGRRVLLIDLDPQANLTILDLGVARDDDRYDAGRGAAITLQMGGAFGTVVSVGDCLDLVPGGPLVAQVVPAMAARPDGQDAMVEHLRSALVELRGRYDLIVIDSAPADDLILRTLLHVCTHLVIPTVEDAGSIDGLRQIGARFAQAQRDGSAIELLGAVLFAVNPQARARNRATRAKVAGIVGDDGVFATEIPAADAAAVDMRELHVSAADLVAETEASKLALFAALRAHGAVERRQWSRDAAPLAAAYRDLTGEILRAITATRTTTTDEQ